MSEINVYFSDLERKILGMVNLMKTFLEQQLTRLFFERKSSYHSATSSSFRWIRIQHVQHLRTPGTYAGGLQQGLCRKFASPTT